MTACTNKARGAVVAALAGALALGAAPAVALAEGAGIELQAVTNLSSAELTSATNAQNSSAAEGATFVPGKGQYLVPTALDGEGIDDSYSVWYVVPSEALTDTIEADHYDGLGVGGNYYRVAGTNEDGSTKYEKVISSYSGGDLNAYQASLYFNNLLCDGGGKPVYATEGTYAVYLTKGSERTPDYEFNLKAAATTLEGAYAYVGDPSNKEIVFNNLNLTTNDIKFADKDGNKLDVVKWKWYKADGTNFAGNTGAVTYAGTYFCDIETRDGKTARVEFVVQPLDLTAADVAYPDGELGPANRTALLNGLLVNGQTINTGIASLLKVTDADSPDYDAKGTHEVTIGVDADAIDSLIEDNSNRKGLEDSIKGSATVEYAVLDDEVASAGTLRYGDYTLSGNPAQLTIDLFSGQAFDSDKLQLVGTDGKTYSGDDQLEVTVDGDATVKGDYDVTVRVKPYKGTYKKWYGGSKLLKLHVTGADLVANQRLYFYLDGKLAGNDATVTYDGGNWLEKLEVVVKDADGNEIDPSNYEVKVTDESGKEVESATDAGDYKVQVNGKTFEFDSDTDADFDLTVAPLSVDNIELVGDITANNTPYLTWTGEELTPDFKFYDKVDGELVEVEVPAEAYDVTYMMSYPSHKEDAELKDAGIYVATFETAVDVKNYVVGGSVEVNVTDKGVFLDVPTDEWYSQAVYDAATNGYMNGDGAGYTFSPMRELTRAEAACVLFNTAGGDALYGNLPGYNEYTGTYETGFSDVTGNEFYAKAIAWAEQTGVINGYADGTFGVSRKVTNEEFACMLANYAKAKGEDVTVEDADATLAAYPDADGVSDWTRESVAWAVEAGVMGNGSAISPAGSILRMRAATMVVNYQPEKADSSLIPIA
ncbi:S-layer homology domain-containing protein [Thermophilibacter sp. ET337]|uniref:S-layer homology domain-containing protein n=1 Tax=Thermophilibacter sp. ET337 TaxID=2973084 RepID=UPI0021AC931B|nr:S-layer homology domain-containing protein [Thermophilibacter sp. ET337]MCR8908837.1 S-layer homology domain-containing protein [Thermophilibacter sp. ET337]